MEPRTAGFMERLTDFAAGVRVFFCMGFVTRLASLHQDEIMFATLLATQGDDIVFPAYLSGFPNRNYGDDRARRHHHGQPVGLGDHAPRRRDADGARRIPCEARIVSAHRTPDRLFAFAKGAKAAGFKVIIAGAGGAAHLPGMAAALTELPVFGVPVGIQGAVRRRLALFDRADAGRRSRRHAGHRQARRHQRRAAGGERAGAERRGAGDKAGRLAQGSRPTRSLKRPKDAA